MKGLIFNIQRFSLHDGPGIRTVVFFKGCPLDCKWCSNPESKKDSVELVYDSRKCAGCLSCVNACGFGAITPDHHGKIKVDREACTLCMACVKACPKRALYTEGSFYTVEALMAEVLKDKAFYDGSGGGVTLSGGEPLAQGAFTIELLKALKKEGLHVVLETCGHVNPAEFSEAMLYIDMLYFDIKHYDNLRHEEKTGAGNALILQNLGYASQKQMDITARIPVIPGYNDSLEDASRFVALLKAYGISKAHLLPFHQYGSGKYDLLGLEYEYRNTPNTPKEELFGFAEVLEASGIRASVGGQ